METRRQYPKRDKVIYAAGVRFAALFLCFVIWTGIVSAEISTDKRDPALVLSDLLNEAVSNNPEIAFAKETWLAEKKKIWTETALPDPEAEVAPGKNENRYSVMQTIPFPAKLYLQGKMASKEAQAAYFRYRVTERDVRLKVAETYYDLYLTDASIQVIEEMKTLLKRFESIASSRYANRTGSQRDVAKMQAEVSMTLEKSYRLDQKRESTAAIMNALLNRDPMAPVGKAILPAKPQFDFTLMEAVELAIENRNEIKEAAAMSEKSMLGKRLAALAYIPDVSIGVEYELSKMEDGTNNTMIPIRFSLPVWQNRIIPEIQKAEHLEAADKAKLVEAKNTAYREVKDAFYRFQTAIKTADLYEIAVIPQAQIALNADLAGYESKSTDFLNLLDSERVYLNARLSQVEFYVEALKAYVDLLRCCGLDFSFSEKGEKL